MKMLDVMVYISGKYGGETVWDVTNNIHAAEQVLAAMWEAGIPALCPHKNTAYLDGLLTRNQWIAGDLIMLKRCDAIFMLPGWEDSAGACEERAYALANGIPIFDDIATLICWARDVF